MVQQKRSRRLYGMTQWRGRKIHRPSVRALASLDEQSRDIWYPGWRTKESYCGQITIASWSRRPPTSPIVDGYCSVCFKDSSRLPAIPRPVRRKPKQGVVFAKKKGNSYPAKIHYLRDESRLLCDNWQMAVTVPEVVAAVAVKATLCANCLRIERNFDDRAYRQLLEAS